MALLRDVVAEQGKVKAADTLGVSFRTLSRAEDTGRLTPRLADAFGEPTWSQGGGTAAAHPAAAGARSLSARLAAVGKGPTGRSGSELQKGRGERRVKVLARVRWRSCSGGWRHWRREHRG